MKHSLVYVGRGGPGGSGECARVTLLETGDVETAQVVCINVDICLYVYDADVYVVLNQHKAP